ncbi:MAG: YcaO-like family protein [Defluviitaleaceae bacterium]|nr:YcaO-like family protein [Defluviitaleaceae bacterium]MCL2274495.1 YcaO-like family protein [Defluviitaleaceae bacterium]
MDYQLSEIPLVNKTYSYQNDKVNDRVICSSLGEVKVLNCDPQILEEVLSSVDGTRTFANIEENFMDRYSAEEVNNFLNVILQEGIIVKSEVASKAERIPQILVIGEGFKVDCLKNHTYIAVSSFLNAENNLDFDIALFAPLSSKYSEVLSINRKLYQYKKPFVQIGFNGTAISAGPLVVPEKSACLECVVNQDLNLLNKKVRYSNGKEITLTDLKSLNYSYDVPAEFSGLAITVGNILLKDLTNFFGGGSSDFLDSQYLFDNTNLIGYTKRKRLPTTSCDFCNAINKNYIRFDSNFSFDGIFCGERTELMENKIEYQVGGLRSKNENETKQLLEAELGKLGAKVKVKFSSGNPFNSSDVIHCYDVDVEQTEFDKASHIFREDTGSGKGITKSQAYFSAAFELLEHMGLQYTGNIPIVCGKYSEVKDFAVDVPYLASTIMNTYTAYDNFDENLEMDWVVATSLTDGSQKLVPAFLVFMFDVELKGILFNSSSNGAAAAATLEDAILHGLFEAIERDAFVIGNSNPYVLPMVDYANVTNMKIRELLSRANEMGYDVITRDYTNDIGVPVFRTWMVDRKNYSKYAYNGTGCHISPEIALERSITEAIQSNDSSDYGGNAEPDVMTQEAMLKSQVNLYNQHFLINKDVLGKTDKTTTIGEPILGMDSSYNIIKKVADQVKEKVGGDVYYVDMTKPGMNVKVVKVIITGDIQTINVPMISTSKRIFDFGVTCGYSDKEATYEELFMGQYNI